MGEVKGDGDLKDERAENVDDVNVCCSVARWPV